MNRLCTLLAALSLLALAIFASVKAHAQDPSKKIITDPGKAKKGPSIDRKPLETNNAKKIATGLRIDRFDVTRGAKEISLSGVIENVSLQPLTNVSYAMFKRTPSGWQRITGGTNITINRRRISSLHGLDAATNAAVLYKLDVNAPGQSDSREFLLPARTISYVVRYDTKGNWLLARYWGKSEETAVPGGRRGEGLPGGVPQRLRDSLRSLGFEAKMPFKRYDYPFSDTEFEFWVYARTATPLQRTFTTRQAAVEFRDSLRSQIADRNLIVDILEK